jgi:hypothetical protein
MDLSCFGKKQTYSCLVMAIFMKGLKMKASAYQIIKVERALQVADTCCILKVEIKRLMR